ncbi:hypothetical protein EN943_03290 [Mesorhizobium sp. M7A.F.Ca.US.006.01.1.1]|nr:hypothetical protein EN943_03290 [Mesorhizobium sp. M7A.F.Ca.US.006.01.1.1]
MKRQSPSLWGRWPAGQRGALSRQPIELSAGAEAGDKSSKSKGGIGRALRRPLCPAGHLPHEGGDRPLLSSPSTASQ